MCFYKYTKLEKKNIYIYNIYIYIYIYVYKYKKIKLTVKRNIDKND